MADHPSTSSRGRGGRRATALGYALAVIVLGSCTRALHEPERPPRPPVPGTLTLDRLDKEDVALQATQEATPPAGERSLIDEVGTEVQPPPPNGHIGGIPAAFLIQSGKSRLIELARPVRRVSVGDPEVADIILVSPSSVLVNGRRVGDTSLILWDQHGVSEVHTITVQETSERQVLLEITVAELNRTAMEQHGVDFRVLRTDLGLVFQPAKIAPLFGSFPPQTSQPLFPLQTGENVTLAVLDPNRDIAVFFEFIQKEGLGKILARPRLVARSGHEAKFLSGGEIPIVIAEALQTSVTFKEFGTRVRFKPIVLADDTIDLEVNPEVSEPDFSNSVSLFGFSVPSFITRRADTRVTLKNGESLVIAGLFRDVRVETTQKVPYLGDAPLLGYLFRKTSYTHTKNELMIVVRARLAEPTPAGVAVAVPDRGPFRPEEVRTQRTDAPMTRPRLSRPAPTGDLTTDASLDAAGDAPVHGWSVQVSATANHAAADALAATLRARGIPAYVRRARQSGAPLYRVRIGPYVTTEDAIQEAKRLRHEPDIADAVVVSE